MRGHIALMEYRLASHHTFGSLAESFARVQVSIEPREITRADLYADSMAAPEDVAGCPQIDREQIGVSGFHQLWRAGRFAIARADDSVEQIVRISVRMNIDQFRGEIGIDR